MRPQSCRLVYFLFLLTSLLIKWLTNSLIQTFFKCFANTFDWMASKLKTQVRSCQGVHVCQHCQSAVTWMGAQQFPSSRSAAGCRIDALVIVGGTQCYTTWGKKAASFGQCESLDLRAQLPSQVWPLLLRSHKNSFMFCAHLAEIIQILRSQSEAACFWLRKKWFCCGGHPTLNTWGQIAASGIKCECLDLGIKLAINSRSWKRTVYLLAERLPGLRRQSEAANRHLAVNTARWLSTWVWHKDIVSGCVTMILL